MVKTSVNVDLGNIRHSKWKEKVTRELKGINTQQFKDDINNLSMKDDITNCSDASQEVHLFNTAVGEVLDKHAPFA